MTSTSQRFFRRWVATLLCAVSVAACGGSVARCGAGTKEQDGTCVGDTVEKPGLTCGAGTVEDAGQCVAVAPELPLPDSGVAKRPDAGNGSDSAPLDVTRPMFGGATFAETAGEDAVLVHWNVARDDVTPAERMKYEVAWGEKSGFTPNWTGATSAAGATKVVVRKLPKPSTAYFFVARALDEAGNVGENDHEVKGSTGADVSPPVFAGCRAVSAITHESFVVSWDPATDNGTNPSDIVYEIRVEPVGVTGHLRSTPPTKTTTGGTSVTIDGLTAGFDYRVLCTAVDAAGNPDVNDNVLDAPTLADAPPVFGGVVSAAPDSGPGTVRLSWAPAKDDVTASGDIVYAVYVADSPGQENFAGAPELLSAPGDTSIVVAGLTSRTTHYFVVQARDRAGNQDENTVEASAVLGISFELDVQPIFTAACAIQVCHTTGADGTNAPIQGLDLDDGAANSNIVDVVAREGANIGEPLLKRVDATSLDPNDSYLWRKLVTTTTIFGLVMPTSAVQTVLTPDQIQTIADWIASGSPNN